MTVQIALASEQQQRRCYHHQDRPAVFVRIEERTKPIPQTRRIPECRECADRRRPKDEGLIEVRLVQL